ncbi:MAG: EamA family transporter [Bacteroidetes bacterium]|nr:EamA family transporter [Bacteroidota bacterium]
MNLDDFNFFTFFNNSRSKREAGKYAYLALTGTSIIWGTTWVASKIAVNSGISGLEVSYIRQFIAGVILVLYFLLKGEKLPSWQQFRWLFILSIFMFVMANGLSTWGVKFIPSGLAALIGALYPLCVILIEIIFFRVNNSSRLTFIGLIMGLGGVTMVLYENTFHKQPEGYVFGIILGMIAMLAWSIGTLFIVRNKYQMNPYYAMGWQMFMASFMIYGLAKVTGNDQPFSAISWQTWAAIGYLIIMGSIIAFIAFIYTTRYLPTVISSLYAYINPIVAMIVGAFLLGEKLTFFIIVGAMITLTGVYLVNRSLKKMKMDQK